MRMLQALVIFMAVLIFIAMGFLVYGLMTRVDVVEDVVNPAPALTGKAFNDVNVTLPAGASSCMWQSTVVGTKYVCSSLPAGVRLAQSGLCQRHERLELLQRQRCGRVTGNSSGTFACWRRRGDDALWGGSDFAKG